MAGAGELPYTPVLRLRRLDAAVADPPRRDVRLDRRPRPARPAVAERAGRPRVDRPLRATATATASSSTSAGPSAACSNQGWKDSSDAIRDRDGPRPCRRSPSPRSRATSSTPSAGWPAWPRVRGETSSRSASTPRPRRCATASRRRSGSRTSATTRSRSTATSARPTRSARTPASACGPGSSRPSGRAPSSSGCSSPRCSRAGGSGPMRRASRATTRSATTPERSGRTTRRSSPRA